jgi:hypothetical protein
VVEQTTCRIASRGLLIEIDPGLSAEGGPTPVKLNARYVSIGDFDDLYFQVSFGNRHPAADFDPSAPTKPYLLLQRQFEDADRGLCYLETHDIDRFAGHYRLRLIEFTPTRLVFEIDRPEDRSVEVTHNLSIGRFREVQRVVHIIFGVEPWGRERAESASKPRPIDKDGR